MKLPKNRTIRLFATILCILALLMTSVVPAAANLSGSKFEGSDGNLIVNTSGNTDWATVAGLNTGIDQPSGSSDNAFGQGTKEDSSAVTVVDGSIPPNKNDLTRFYEASEQASNGHIYLYLGWERLVNIGNANLDFEINQNATSSFTGTTTGPVTLNRTAGDLLVTYDFGGSGTPTLGLLTWLTAGAGNTVSQCYSANSLPCWGKRVDLTGAGEAEGAVNTASVSDPILGSTLGTGLFGEAAVDLTAAGVFQPGVCSAFGSTFVKSRSSSSFTAEIKDFIAPIPVTISNCGTITVRKVTENGDGIFGYTTTGGLTPSTFNLSNNGTRTYEPVNPGTYSVTENLTSSQVAAGWTLKSLSCTASGTGTSKSISGATVSITMGLGGTVDCTYTNHTKLSPSIATTLSTTAAAIGQNVHDSATLSGATSTAGGSVTYSVYTDNTCSTLLTTAGAKTVTNGVVPDSDNVSFSNAGTYYWQAVYSGDANNNSATSLCTSEIVTVGKNSPSISTTLSASTGKIGDTVHDTATLTGATSSAGGTVAYTVYTDSSCSQNAQSAGTKTVTNGGVPDSDGIQFNSAGTYYWQAVYSGDANNNGATSACTSEILVIHPNPSISTTLSATSTSIGSPVHDSATLSGATTTAGGTVTYHAYAGQNTCTGTDLLNSTKTVTNGVVPDSDPISFTSAGYYSFQAVYSGDANNNGATSVCSTEQLTVNPNGPSIATTLSTTSTSIGTAVHDSATLTGATSNAGGTVTYTVYSDSSCSASFAAAGTKTVTNGVVPDSDSVTFNAAGTYYWQAVYSGDANNNGATSLCTSEIVTVGKNSPSVSTTLSATSVDVGSTVHDSATLSGATSNAGGTVTYTVYTDSACTQGAQGAGTKTVVSGAVPDSDPITFNNAGDYYWQAVYSGDANNNPATSLCTSEHLVVNKKQPAESTAQNLLPNDTFTLSGGFNPTGTVTFELFSPSDATCSGAPAYSQTVTVNGNGTYSTSNTTFHATAEGTWRWEVTYSGDANNLGVSSLCGVEQFTIANH